MIHLGIVEPDTAAGRNAVLGQLLQAGNLTDAVISKDTNGKPRLIFTPPRRCGYSIAQIRIGPERLAVMAICEGADLGVDAEVRRRGAADAAFLETIAAPEDGTALKLLGADGFDPSVGLWTIKEAALKCSGEVMIDPRHLAAARHASKAWKVSPSVLAGAPFAQVLVKLLSASLADHGPVEIIIALATSAEKMPDFKYVTAQTNLANIVTV